MTIVHDERVLLRLRYLVELLQNDIHVWLISADV